MKIFSKWHLSATQIIFGVLALGVWVLVAQNGFSSMLRTADAAPAKTKTTTFDTINVHRINIVDAHGNSRLVIADPSHFPNGKLRGKTYKRSIHDTSGIIFYKANGDETGGLAVSKLPHSNQVALIFDYTHQPTDGISMGRHESFDGKHWSTGFFVHDRRPYHPGKIKSSQGVKRISLGDSDKKAELVISDPDGHPRIRIGVDESGKPRMQMLDASGKVVYRAPLAKPAKQSDSAPAKG